MVSSGRGLEVIRYMVFEKEGEADYWKDVQGPRERTGQSRLCSASLL